MFDLGMSELLIIGIVALIVIGPRDLPELFRSLGRFTAKLRSMAREFSRAMEAAADEAGAKDVRDVANDLRKVTSPKAMGVDALRDAASSFEKWDPMKGAQSGPKPAPKATETPASPPATPAPEKGPNTQALAEAQAARRAAQAEARAAKKAAAEAPAAPAKPAKKAPAKAPAKAPTKTAPKTAAKPAPKPKKKPDA